MKKAYAGILLLMVLVAASGCAQKSESEQLRDDMKKAGDQLGKDINNLVK